MLICLSKSLNHRRRGLTLMEVVLASLFLFMISSSMITSMIFAMRMQRSNMQVARMTQISRHFLGRFSDDVRRARLAVVTNSGNTIQVTIPNAAGGGERVAQFAYLDLDGNPLTIQDNVFRYDADVNDANNSIVDLAKFLSPVSGTPIFSYTSDERTVFVTIRFGDNNESTQAKDATDVFTGPGLQMIVINSRYQHRNQ